MGSAEELIRGLQFDSPLGATLTIVVALLSLVLVAAIHTAISGLIGNRFDAGVLAVRKALRSRYIVITAWSLTVIPVIVLVLLAVGLLVRTYWVFVITSVSVMLLLGVSLFIPLYRVFRNKAPLGGPLESVQKQMEAMQALNGTLQQQLETMQELLLNNQGTLVRFLPLLTAAEDQKERDRVVVTLLRELLIDCAQMFDETISRGLILRPDPNDRSQLVPWYVEGNDGSRRYAEYGMESESLGPKRFYIGEATDRPGQRRGVAGVAFKQGGIHVVHFTKKGRRWEPDEYREHYVEFIQSRRTLPYRVFAAIALPIDGPEEDRVGVLCLDSMRRDCFDPPELQALLTGLASRFVAGILVYNHLKDRTNGGGNRTTGGGT